MAQSWFTPDFLQFFAGLRAQNTKDYFDAHRKTYENAVKKPFQAFLTELLLQVHARDPRIRLEPKETTFRINRDIRFSADKSPYNTHVSAIISPTGRKDMGCPGFYLQFNEQEIWLGGGAYFIDPKKLPMVRDFIAQDLDAFEAVISAPNFVKHYKTVQGDAHKRIAADWKDAAARQPLLMNKNFYIMRELPADKYLTGAKLMGLVLEYYDAAQDFNLYFQKALGY